MRSSQRLAEGRSRLDAPDAAEPDAAGPSSGARHGLRRYGPAPRHSHFEQLQQRHQEGNGAEAPADDARRTRRHPPRNYAEDLAYGSSDDEPAAAPARQSGRRQDRGSGAAGPSADAQRGSHADDGRGFQEAYTSSGRHIKRPASYAEHGSLAAHERQPPPLRSASQRSTRRSASVDNDAAAAQQGSLGVSRSGRPVRRHNYAEDDPVYEDGDAHAAPQPRQQGWGSPRRRSPAAGASAAARPRHATAAGSPSHTTRSIQRHAASGAHDSGPDDADSDGSPLPAWGAGRRSDRRGRQPVTARLRLGGGAGPPHDADEGASEPSAGRPTSLRIKLKRR